MRNFRPNATAPQRRRRFADAGGSLALPAGGGTMVEELKLDGVNVDLRQGRDVDDLLDFLGDDGGGDGGRNEKLTHLDSEGIGAELVEGTDVEGGNGPELIFVEGLYDGKQRSIDFLGENVGGSCRGLDLGPEVGESIGIGWW
ncbi:DUF2169 domain-containing protein [Sesbania bispinosa]|nr:DUF2169 domain-containing protein [Sesbania bispinosa]